jgi:hypothetical protein
LSSFQMPPPTAIRSVSHVMSIAEDPFSSLCAADTLAGHS